MDVDVATARIVNASKHDAEPDMDSMAHTDADTYTYIDDTTHAFVMHTDMDAELGSDDEEAGDSEVESEHEEEEKHEDASEAAAEWLVLPTPSEDDVHVSASTQHDMPALLTPTSTSIQQQDMPALLIRKMSVISSSQSSTPTLQQSSTPAPTSAAQSRSASTSLTPATHNGNISININHESKQHDTRRDLTAYYHRQHRLAATYDSMLPSSRDDMPDHVHDYVHVQSSPSPHQHSSLPSVPYVPQRPRAHER